MLWAAVIALQACRETGKVVNPGEYLPLEAGAWSVYDMYEEVYSSGQPAPAVRTWQERDLVTAVTVEGGRATFFITTSTRNTPDGYWQAVKQYTIDRYPDRIVTTRDNRSLVTMTFPVNSYTEWNANAYNPSEEEWHRYTGIGAPVKVGERTYENTVTVLERDYETLINFYKGERLYAPGVGLVREEQTNFEYCQDEDCIGSATVESGTYRLRIRSGQEN